MHISRVSKVFKQGITAVTSYSQGFFVKLPSQGLFIDFSPNMGDMSTFDILTSFHSEFIITCFLLFIVLLELEGMDNHFLVDMLIMQILALYFYK